MVQFRVNGQWSQNLDEIIRQTKTVDSTELDRSKFARGILALETAMWRKSPYVCPQARHFVFVTRRGRFYYHRTEQLQLNSDVESIPSVLTMKREKREYFTQHYQPDEMALAWPLNCFLLWDGSSPTGVPIDVQSDHSGKTRKWVSLQCRLPKRAWAFREGCFVLQDYAQYAGDDQVVELYDRVDIMVDIPTRDLEIFVVVDRQLYTETRRFGGAHFDPRLRFEFRNREEMPFADPDTFEAILRENFLQKISSTYPVDTAEGPPDQLYLDSRAGVEECFRLMQERLDMLFRDHTDLVGTAQREDFADLAIPESYLFYRVHCTWTHLGLVYSVKWPKPELPR